jgi:hypothetical protein
MTDDNTKSKLFLSACIILAASSCDKVKACDDDAYRQATLTALSEAGMYPTDVSGCAWLEVCTEDNIVQAHIRASKIRNFSKTVKDPCAARAYLSWADFVDYQADEGENQMKTHMRQNEYEEYQKESRETNEAAAKLLETIQRPK